MVLKCPHCDEEFPNYATRLKHVETAHHVPHNCPVPNCYYRTARKWYMRKHTKLVHGANSIRCPVEGCEGYFVKRVLQKHIKEYHGDKKEVQSAPVKLQKTTQKCEYCDFSTQSTKKFEAHVKDTHLNGFVCPVEGCEQRIFADRLDVHFKALHRDVPYQYSLGKGLKLKEVQPQKEEKMDVDAYNEDGQQQLDDELEKENSDMDFEYDTISNSNGFDGFKCSKCDKKFMVRRALIRHIARVHEKRYKKYERASKFPCTFEGCEKSFKCQTLLDDHINAHNQNYAYSCENCSQKFFARARYAVHLKKYHKMSIKDAEKNNVFSASNNVSRAAA